MFPCLNYELKEVYYDKKKEEKKLDGIHIHIALIYSIYGIHGISNGVFFLFEFY